MEPEQHKRKAYSLTTEEVEAIRNDPRRPGLIKKDYHPISCKTIWDIRTGKTHRIKEQASQ